MHAIIHEVFVKNNNWQRYDKIWWSAFVYWVILELKKFTWNCWLLLAVHFQNSTWITDFCKISTKCWEEGQADQTVEIEWGSPGDSNELQKYWLQKYSSDDPSSSEIALNFPFPFFRCDQCIGKDSSKRSWIWFRFGEWLWKTHW